MEQEATQNDLQAAIKLRGADVYAGFLIPHIRPGATVLDCGCGAGTITLGLAEAVPDGHVIGADLDLGGLKSAQRAAVSLGHQNVSWIGADGRSLPFHDAVFDAVLCHSMLETLDDPTPVIAELGRVTYGSSRTGSRSSANTSAPSRTTTKLSGSTRILPKPFRNPVGSSDWACRAAALASARDPLFRS